MDATELALKAPVTQAKLQMHVFVCTGSSCSKNGSEATLERFRDVLREKGLLYGKHGTPEGTVLLSKSGSMGLCAVGPAVLIYPQGVWYYHVTPDDVEQIVTDHLIEGRLVERLLAYQF